jgi:molybdenum cofactor cytidylyltransferase
VSSITASTYAGVFGVPAVFPRMAFADLRALRGDKGARSLLVHPPCPVIAVPFPGGEVDIDRPEDLNQLD